MGATDTVIGIIGTGDMEMFYARPNINTKGLPLAEIWYRSGDAHYQLAIKVPGVLQSRVIFLAYEDHDRLTAEM
ncbi:hypothetical protein H4R24_001830 [Coemansia sp. RSA 988]|nr:hypothetical protein H4R24_001830 [Coemansia sp. RSA 988]